MTINSNRLDGFNQIKIPEHEDINLTEKRKAGEGLAGLVLDLQDKTKSQKVTKSFTSDIKNKIKELNTANKELKATKDSMQKMEKTEVKLQNDIGKLQGRQKEIARSLASLPKDQRQLTPHAGWLQTIFSDQNIQLSPGRGKQSDAAVEEKIQEYKDIKDELIKLTNEHEKLGKKMETTRGEIQKFKTSWERASQSLKNLDQAVKQEGLKNKFGDSVKDLQKANEKISRLMEDMGEERDWNSRTALKEINNLKQKYEAVVGHEIFGLSLKRTKPSDKLSRLKEIHRDLVKLNDKTGLSAKAQSKITSLVNKLNSSIQKLEEREAKEKNTDYVLDVDDLRQQKEEMAVEAIRDEEGYRAPENSSAESSAGAGSEGTEEVIDLDDLLARWEAGQNREPSTRSSVKGKGKGHEGSETGTEAAREPIEREEVGALDEFERFKQSKEVNESAAKEIKEIKKRIGKSLGLKIFRGSNSKISSSQIRDIEVELEKLNRISNQDNLDDMNRKDITRLQDKYLPLLAVNAPRKPKPLTRE